MSTRRHFLKQTSLATAALIAAPSTRGSRTNQLIGLQLYTLRNEISKDVSGTLSKVAGIGYNSVEVFGYADGKFFGKTPEDFVTIIKQNNLKTPSGHYMVVDYLTKGDMDLLKKTVDDAAIMGHDFFVIPYLLDNMRTSLDDYKSLADKMNKAGTVVKNAGMHLAYHNHNFEFKDWGEGKTGFEILTKQTDPQLVSFEMDFYWVTRAGLDPIKMIESNPGRIKMWHIKDMSQKKEPSYDTDKNQAFTEVGTGIIDYKEIFKHKRESGMEYFFVEQDQVNLPVYESITKSYQYIKNTILS
jgi:sugar phosphate isomerase/epimerase